MFAWDIGLGERSSKVLLNRPACGGGRRDFRDRNKVSSTKDARQLLCSGLSVACGCMFGRPLCVYEWQIAASCAWCGRRRPYAGLLSSPPVPISCPWKAFSMSRSLSCLLCSNQICSMRTDIGTALAAGCDAAFAIQLCKRYCECLR